MFVLAVLKTMLKPMLKYKKTTVIFNFLVQIYTFL